MPPKKPLVPTRRIYSRDLKWRIIYQTDVLRLTSSEISTNLDIPVRVVQRVRKIWNETGEVCKNRTTVRRAEHCEVSIYELITDNSQSQLLLHL